MNKYDDYIGKYAAVVDKGTFGPEIWIGIITLVDEEDSDAGGDDMINAYIKSSSFGTINHLKYLQDDGDPHYVDLFLTEIKDTKKEAEEQIFISLFNMFWPGGK